MREILNDGVVTLNNYSVQRLRRQMLARMLVLAGISHQDTYSGKNMLDSSTIKVMTLNGITCTYDREKQEITFNGTCTKDNTLFQLVNTIFNVVTNTTKVCIYYVGGSVSGYFSLRFFDSNYRFWYNSRLK